MKVGHEHDGNHDLIGGKPQKKGHEDNPVQPHKPSQRIKESGQMKEQALPAHGSVGQDPDDQTGRRRDSRRPAKDEKGAVQNGADQDLADLGAAVGGKFQGEGGGDSF